MRISTDISVNAGRVEINVPPGTEASRLANCVFCPLGPAPTQAYVVMTAQALTHIVPNGANVLSWVMTNDNNDPPVTLNFQRLYFVGAKRLLAGGPVDQAALHLVELADARYIAAKFSDTGIIISNLRSYSHSSAYLSGTGPDTWESLLLALWNACGVLGDYPGLPAGLPIDGAPENEWLVGMNAYQTLCAMLDQLDCAIAHDPFNDVYTIVQLGAVQAIPDNDDTLQWNGSPSVSIVSSLPANLQVYFNYHRKSYGQEKDTEFVNNWKYNGVGKSIATPTGVTGTVGNIPLWDDLSVVLDETGNEDNSSAVDTRVENRKLRYLARYGVTPLHRVHWGLTADYLPGPQVTAVLWRNWGSKDGTVTEFTCGSDLWKGRYKSGNGTGLGTGVGDSIQKERYLPPDLIRQTYANYPRLPNIVQVTSIEGNEPGTQQQATADGLHSGVVRKWINGAMDFGDAVWIMFVDDYDNKAGNVSAVVGEYYGPARLSGLKTAGGFTRPLYLVRQGSATSAATEVVLFKLTQTLELSSSTGALAKILNFTNGAYAEGNTITVLDVSPTLNMWRGNAGARGFARRRDDGKYEIIYMQRPAQFIEFKNAFENENGYGGSVRTFASPSWNAQYIYPDHEAWGHGDLGPIDRESGVLDITIHDSNSFFPRPALNGWGYAVWDEIRNQYKCISVNQIASFAKAKVNDNSGMSGNPNSDVRITQFEVVSPTSNVNSPSPVPEFVANPYGHKGKDQDDILLMWSDDDVTAVGGLGGQLGAWIVIDVIKKSKTVIMNIRIHNNQLQVQQTECAVEYDQDPDWVDKIPTASC